MSNSSKMTLEERLVQSIKETHLAALVDDEVAITELTARAIKQALFDPRTVTIGWNTKTTPSRVMEAADKAADKLLNEATAKVVEDLLADPTVKAAVIEAIIVSLPTAIMSASLAAFDKAREDIKHKAETKAWEIVEEALKRT